MLGTWRRPPTFRSEVQRANHCTTEPPHITNNSLFTLTILTWAILQTLDRLLRLLGFKPFTMLQKLELTAGIINSFTFAESLDA